jgi:hypothetical protein
MLTSFRELLLVPQMVDGTTGPSGEESTPPPSEDGTSSASQWTMTIGGLALVATIFAL